ncbi:uncharacterized protein UMAG_02861 [Mycosarcoma maydis]|uniref:DUF2423 domain-containing protein n=1 Tax=Mycosarcoma maydis TaxID=5270 RepID=A0A0D1DXG9_MYCMD|nr:uncharacterized protein UMAG_02861 [Ustilago maydis 521]KIS68874.1 hypothetical protein UMAG_02861 [Ustilago maydis 521]|eukprot:XP_011389297.1 hypothetical protein UMAG_02861 [Ustilago maydis 521]
MAKSLRSSSKLKARNQKRSNPKSDYAVAEAARVNALSARLAAGLNKDKLPVQGDSKHAEEEMIDIGSVEKQEDGATQQNKISTSGHRDSRRETYRKSRGLKPFKNSGGNSLFDAHKSKNNGKAKRRR